MVAPPPPPPPPPWAPHLQIPSVGSHDSALEHVTPEHLLLQLEPLVARPAVSTNVQKAQIWNRRISGVLVVAQRGVARRQWSRTNGCVQSSRHSIQSYWAVCD